MKALTLTQPWATLVAIGAKTIETRSWRTEYRGRIAIHAAKHFPADARVLCPQEPFAEALGSEILHTAQIVATATMAECFAFGVGTEAKVRRRSAAGRLPPHEADFGDFSPGRFGFVLRDVVRLPQPIAARGMLNLWNIPRDVEDVLTTQLAQIGVAA